MPTSFLTIIFIVWIVVPGTLFKRFYFQGFFAKQFRAGDFADRIITSVFWGIIIQIVTFSLFQRFGGIDYELIKNPIAAIYASFAGNQIPDLSEVNFNFLLGYITATLTIAICTGFLSHQTVRSLKFDTKFRVFRFANHWHYYLMGDITSLKNHTTTEKKGKWLTTQADIIIKEGKDRPKMFSGHVSDYFISGRTGELESIILRNGKRWCDENKGFKPVPGDALMIPYGNVMDMNLTYVTKAVDYFKLNRRKVHFVNLLLGAGGMCCVLFPLFTKVSFVRKFAGIGMLLMALIFFIALVELSLRIDRSKVNKSRTDDSGGEKMTEGNKAV